MTARPRGEQGFVKREGPSWIGYWHEYESAMPGARRRQKRRKLGDAREMSKAEAKRELAVFLAEHRPEAITKASTVAQVWASHQRRYDRTGTGQAATMRSLYEKHVKPRFGDVKVADVTTQAIEQFFDALAHKGFSESLRDKARVLLRSLFDRAVAEGAIQRTPFMGAYIRIESAGPQAALTVAEVRAIRLQLADEEDRIKFDLCCLLGLDRSALRGLRLDDITPQGLRIDEGRVEGQVTKLKTRRRHAVIALPADLQERLMRLKPLAEKDPQRWLFPALRGSGPFSASAWLEQVIRPAAKRAGVAKQVARLWNVGRTTLYRALS